MSPKFLHALILLSAFLCACTVQVDPAAESEPVDAGTEAQQIEVSAAAKAIAGLLDAGRYADAWDHVSPILAARSSQQEFASYLGSIRRPLGAAGSREIKGFGFPTQLDGAPPGRYGLIVVETDFANATGVQERFVFQHTEGKWKLVGYFLTKKFTFGAN